ncbi:AAA family ATPase [Amycolatopsis nigrescens]|uniref:AAA family ATPase n=1 Tax=Amycolatopsis nigrescens TaxID=381445 RepID=UPI00039ACD9D|nr:AAA family ATPase [Amycolatopsis nigrescens]
MSKAVILITGISAAGKSTVAQLLAESIPDSVHVRGDLFRKMVVRGGAEMSAEPSPEAIEQLRLRYRLAATTADEYFRAGFTVVLQDVMLGEYLTEVVGLIRSRPLLVVVLAPKPDAVQAREDGRAKSAYGDYGVADMDAELRTNTPKVGLWLDTSAQSPAETVREILDRAWTEAVQP